MEPEAIDPPLRKHGHVGQREPHGLEAQAQHERVEVSIGDEIVAANGHHRVVAAGVQLDLDGMAGKRDVFAHRSVHLGHHSKGDRVLHGCSFAPVLEVAAGQRLAHVLAGSQLAFERFGPRHLSAQWLEVATNRLQ